MKSIPASTEIITIEEAINKIVDNLYDFKLDKTVDKVITGDVNLPLEGIATAFLPTIDVIKKAILKGINLIITHEPVFYGHDIDTRWLEENNVFKIKSDLIKSNEITIWRLHDYKHRKSPDPILKAITDRLGWGEYINPNNEKIFNLTETKLKDILKHIKIKLEQENIRWIGDPDLVCKRAGILIGAPGGKMQISLMEDNQLDLLICGEINEWEISEYIKDANSAGLKKSLIIIGHETSENDGIKLLAERLKKIFPNIQISHIEQSKDNPDQRFNLY